MAPLPRRAGLRSGTHGEARDGRGYPQQPPTPLPTSAIPPTRLPRLRSGTQEGAVTPTNLRHNHTPAHRPHTHPPFPQPVVPDPDPVPMARGTGAATTQTRGTTNHPRNPTPHVGCASCGRPTGVNGAATPSPPLPCRPRAKRRTSHPSNNHPDHPDKPPARLTRHAGLRSGTHGATTPSCRTPIRYPWHGERARLPLPTSHPLPTSAIPPTRRAGLRSGTHGAGHGSGYHPKPATPPITLAIQHPV